MRERAMELALDVYSEMELAFLDAQEGDAEANSRRLLINLANDIYNFLKGQNQ
jgi:hypothetical protein